MNATRGKRNESSPVNIAPGVSFVATRGCGKALRLGTALSLAFVLMGCGGGGSSPVITVAVSAPCTSVLVSTPLQFIATVTGTTNRAVNWSVNGILGGNSSLGSITTGGLYTAPGTPGTVTVTATSQADTSKSGSATVTIDAALPPITPSQLVTVTGGIQTPNISIDVPSVCPSLQFLAAGVGNTAGVTGVVVKQANAATLLLVGNGFVPGTSYAFSGTGATVVPPVVFTQTTTGIPAVRVSVQVDPTAALGSRNIMVTNAAGELAVFPGGLQIIQGP